MSEQPHNPPGEEVRRGFFVQFAAGAIGVVVGLVPLVTGMLFFLNPLLKKKSVDGAAGGSREGFVNLRITAASLPEDGTPQAVKVFADKVDAWNKFKNVEIGTVWLRLVEGQVIAFSTICPHLGCAIDFRQANQDFYCPCHTSTFGLDGERSNQIPPRDMDALAIETDAATGEIWLKYERFRAATPEKKPI